MSKGFYYIVFVGFLVLIVGPVIEELIFRGIVINYMFIKSNWWANVFASGILFGLAHVLFQFEFFAFLGYAGMGFIFAIVYKKTAKLQYAMILHLLNNLPSFIMMIIFSSK